MRTQEEQESVNTVIECMQSFGYNCKSTTEQFKGWDIDITGKTTGVIEVKNRQLTPDEFQKYFPEGLFLQCDKYEKLKGKKAMYANVFNYDSVQLVLTWSIDKLDMDKVTKKMTDSQEFSKTGGAKVEKEVYMLSENNCVAFIKYMEYPWKRLPSDKILGQVKNAGERSFYSNK